MPKIAVAHLVRPAHGIEALEAFLRAYRALDAGIGHDLVVIFKGFEGPELPEYLDRLAGVPHLRFDFPDVRFDIGAYLAVARAFDHDYLCFLNSHATPLAPGWLATLHRHAAREGVGVVGATASYESHLTGWMKNVDRPDRFYPRWLRPIARLAPKRLALIHAPNSGCYPHLKDFPAFPNPHLRTNGFLIRRDSMNRLEVGDLVDKWDAFKFEGGRRGMTRQIMAWGLAPIVVGRDGQAYGVDRWYESRTFRSGDQSNLLIADNQTRNFAETAATDPATWMRQLDDTWGGRIMEVEVSEKRRPLFTGQVV